MRTKYVLATLALPALFAACSNDDFEQLQGPTSDNSVLQGRAKGNIALSVTKEGANADANTRVVGDIDANNSINWMWEGKDDKLGAVVVDYKTDGSIVDLATYPFYAITNYPFAPEIEVPAASAKFSTPTAVVSGAYMFYNKYDGQNTSRRVISHEIDRLITVDAGTEAGLKQVGTNPAEGGQNFFISPVIDLAIADGADIAKPVSLSSVYSVLHFKLKTDLVGDYYAKGFKVNKIVLKTLGKDGNQSKDLFMRKLTLDPAAIAKIQKDLGIQNPTLFKSNGAIDAMRLTDEEIGTALSLVNDKFANPVNKIGEVTEGTEDLVYQLATPFTFTSKDQAMDLMVIMPAGIYHKATGLPEYGGKTEGVLQMTVYTSEGTYDNYILNDDYTFLRGKKYNIVREMIIDGGRTNVNLFDPNAGFNVETTEDYNYVIDYIKAHYRDFGNSSSWKTPVLNLVAGKTIDVDAEHYFPSFPVKYTGAATLKLVGENQTYKFEPENVILGEDVNRPTINVADANSTIKFEEDVKTVAGKTDGTDITAAVKLISAGNVEVADGKEVNFELLESKKQLDINEKAIVNISGANAKTVGIVNVKEGSKLNANNTFENSAAMTIEANAVATFAKATTNNGEITVEGLGKLVSTSTFMNTSAGEILVEKCDLQYMNSKDRATAEFKTVTNNGKITIEASVDKKGTYGGLMTVETLLTNNGEISNNGEMSVSNVENSGTIILESDPYALLSITKGNLTNLNGSGSVVLADPTQYEMFDSYYTGRNSLSEQALTGVIETTLDQATYDKVMANYATYSPAGANQQETAWKVLNKITVTGKLDLAATATDNKDFILPENASINSKESTLTINSLRTTGKATKLTAVSANTTITVEDAVTAGGELTVDSKVKLLIKQGAATMLNVTGKLINLGTIDTEESQDANNPNKVMTLVSGELLNQGKLSQKSQNEYSIEGANFKIVYDLISKLGSNLKGDDNYRIEVNNGSYSWRGNLTNSETITPAILKNIITKGRWQDVESGYYGLAWQSGTKYYAIYLNTGTESTQPTEIVTLVTEAKKKVASGRTRTMYEQIVDKVSADTPYDQVSKTWFYIEKNTGTVDLLKAATDVNSWAYGEIYDNTTGTKKGKFNNEM